MSTTTASRVLKIVDAFKSAGVADEQAREAAIALTDSDAVLEDIKSTLRLHSWMLGIIAAGILGQFVASLFN